MYFFGWDPGQVVCLVGVGVFVYALMHTSRSGHRCKRCHEVNRAEAQYCAQCGMKIRT